MLCNNQNNKTHISRKCLKDLKDIQTEICKTVASQVYAVHIQDMSRVGLDTKRHSEIHIPETQSDWYLHSCNSRKDLIEASLSALFDICTHIQQGMRSPFYTGRLLDILTFSAMCPALYGSSTVTELCERLWLEVKRCKAKTCLC